jgi:hypothetical protein
MSLRIFGILITTSSLLKAIDSGAISLGEGAVNALLTSSDPKAKAVAEDVAAQIANFNRPEFANMSGIQKLEAVALAALDVLSENGFKATKDFAIALVQTVFNNGLKEVETIGRSILRTLGIRV